MKVLKFILFVYPILIMAQYPWPVENMYEQHLIVGTLGEFRGFGRALHEGVDIAEPIGTPVLAVSRVIVEDKGYQWVKVYDGLHYFRYIHIEPRADIDPGDTVLLGRELGKIKSIPGLGPHLHFEYEGGIYNPLHFLTPFWDYRSPEIEKMEVVRDGTPGAGEPFPIDPETGLPLVSGYVDIKAWAWDHRVEPDGGSGGKGCAPYKIGYAIYDEQGHLIEGLISRIQFYQTLGYNVGWIYVPGSSYDPVNFIYWVTNYVDKNGYWDTYPLKDGKYRVAVVAYDIQGMYEIKSMWVRVKNECPIIIFTDPSGGEENVDVYDFRNKKQRDIGDEYNFQVSFNKPMDTLSVISALRVVNIDKDSTPVAIKNIWWADDRTILVRCHDTATVKDDTTGLQFNTNYQVRILGTAADTSGLTLDGNKNGKSEGSPIDDYLFTFKTRKPDVSFEMISLYPHQVQGCERSDTLYASDNASCKLENKEKRRGFTVKFTGQGFGDGNFSFLASEVSLPADSIITEEILIMNYKWSYHVDVTAKFFPHTGKNADSALYEDTDGVDGVVVFVRAQCCPPSPDCDTPDDNGSISNPNYPTPWYYNPKSKIGILNNGASAGMGHLLGRFKMPTALVNTDLRILGTYNSIDSLQVLIIPSGGLFGLENNYLFKQKIKEFIQNGGTVLCMTQQRSYEFSTLFDGVSGYGWQEDYSCQSNSAYLSEWHTVLSGQTELISSIPIDGFFMCEPESSLVLMRRRVSGMPELIIYPLGAGKVILTGSYVDFGYGVNQWTNSAVNLIRDIVTWALDTKRPISEYYSQNSMSLHIPIHYYSDEDTTPANRVKVKILKPNRDSLYATEFPIIPPLDPGDSTVINLSYIAPSILGIYPINYSLYNDTVLLQEERLGERFAVKRDVPVGNYNLGDFCMWVAASQDHIMVGDTVDFTIFIRNNTEDSLKSLLVFTSHFGPGFYTLDTLKGFMLPPDTIVSLVYSYAPLASGRLMIDLYPDTNIVHPPRLKQSLSTYIWTATPHVELVVKTDTTSYFWNDTVYYQINGLTNFTGVCNLETKIENNGKYYYSFDTLEIDSTLYFEIKRTLPLSDTMPSGTYSISVTLNARGINYSRTGYFQMRYPALSFEVLPDSLITNSDTVSFVAHIEPGWVKIRNCKAFFSIAHQSYGLTDTIYTDSVYRDTISHLDTVRFVFFIPEEKRKEGAYYFNYRFWYLDRTITGRYSLFNSISESPSLDKYMYAVGDTILYTVKMINPNHFLNSGNLISYCPETNFYDSLPLTILPKSETTFSYSLVITDTLSAGGHTITTKFITPAFIDSVRHCFYIPWPGIYCEIDTNIFHIGDTLNVMLYNSGGVIAEVNLSDISLWDYNWNRFYQDSAWIRIYPNDFYFYKLQVPQVMAGPYYLVINGNVAGYNIPINKRVDLWIDGISADIALKTSKDVYLPYEEVRPQADCKNGNYQFKGKMDMSIRPHGLYPGDTTFVPGDEWVWRVDEWSSPGCTLSNNRVVLLGWDKLYWAGNWYFEPSQGRGAKAEAQRELLLRILEAKRQGKGRGDEPIKYTAMAEWNGKLYASLSTDMHRKIIGPYPDWNETYDLPEIASIYQFAMDDNHFYIVDADSGYIYKVARNSGAIEKRWKMTSPKGIGSDGNSLYLIDRNNHSLLKTNLFGDTILVFGADSLVEPGDLAIDNAGRIYVSDLNKARVYIYDNSGNCLGTKGQGRFSQIAIDTKGYLYGADIDSLMTAKYDEHGNLIEYYYNYPDEIMDCDTLVHLANIYSDYFDYVSGEVLTNYGRNKGWTKIEQTWIPGIKYITEFLPSQVLNNGIINWQFMVGYPGRGQKIEKGVWYPIDSISYVDLEDYDNYTPFFKAELLNPGSGNSPEIERLNISYLTIRNGDIIWQDSIPLSLAPQESVLIEKDAGVFSDSGGFILWGDAYLNNGQHLIPSKTHNFYVLPALLALSLKTDREVYYPGEEIKTSAILVNNSDSGYTAINLGVFKRDEKIFDTLFTSIPPHSACTTNVFLSDSISFPLKGYLFRSGLDTLKQYKSIEIEMPDIYFWTAYPCSVSHYPFEVETEVSNLWSRDVEVVLRSTCGDSVYLDTFVLLPNESRIFEHIFTIADNETLRSAIVRPREIAESFEIRFGEKLEVMIDSVVSSENSVLIPYSVVNSGEFDCAFNLALWITDSLGLISDSVSYHSLLPIGDTLSGEWGITLDYGRYFLNWKAMPESSAVVLSQGSVSLNIIPPNLIAIDSILLLPEVDSVGNLNFDVLIKNNSANNFYGNIGLYGSFINEHKELEIEQFMDTTIRFLSKAILGEGYQVLTARVLQNGIPIVQRSESLYFEAKIGVEEINKNRPSASGGKDGHQFPEIIFDAGDTAMICIKTKNIGTASGVENLRVELGELGEEKRTIALIPGEIKSDTFIFYIPEDMDERVIYGSVWLGDEEYILPIHILGFRVLVSAHLNQPNFQVGDTVVLNLNITNQNERNIKGFSTANYNGENITQDFYLAGYAQHIDLSNPEVIKANEESGVYVSKVLWLGTWDSLKVNPEGCGNYGFWVRVLKQDSIHYSGWSSDTIINSGLIYQAVQFKVEFSDTVSYLERVNLRIFDSLGFKDTIIETFEALDISCQFLFPYEPMANLMFYGVYTETGRGLWLNNIYAFPANDTCNIITDRQVYDMGDTVFATVQSPFNGRLIYNADFYPMGMILDSLFVDSLNNQFNFVLPSELASGTYSIDFSFDINGDTLQKFSSSQIFDVRGYRLILTDCRLDTNEYMVGDSISIRLKLNANSAIPVITRLRFFQNYQWYDDLCDTVFLDSGFNVVDLSTVVPQLERGPAFLNCLFFKDSTFLTYSSEGFMVYVPDTSPPLAQFIQVPSNTYNPNIPHLIKIIATDETRIYDTLSFHNGITLSHMTHQLKNGDTLIYSIPSQPRGTIVSYFISLVDSFGNKTRLPEKDYKFFWVKSPLPPSECQTDTVNQKIGIYWQNPSENLIYHSGYPFEAKTDSIAVRFSPQYLPAELKLVKLFIEKTTPDTAILDLSFYSVIDGRPGLEIYPTHEIKIGTDGAIWVEFQIDSVLLMDEVFIIFSGQGVKFYGDGNNDVYRTIVKDTDWTADTSFGNLLAQARFLYKPETIFYRVMCEDGLQFVVIGDSLLECSFTDSTVSVEQRYRYLVQCHYIMPDLNGTSPVVTQTYDYTSPVFGDSVAVIEIDTGYIVGCEITDGIGVAKDSLIYDGTSVGHDSTVGNWYWWTIPKDRISENQGISRKDIRISCYQGNCRGTTRDLTSGKVNHTNAIATPSARNDIESWTIAYYFTAYDSAGNFARNPNTGYYYIIPVIPEGFSGHITKDTTWVTEILIKGDVWVDSGVTLTIGPGVKVKFIPNFDDEHSGIDSTRAEFIVQGNLVLLGNDSMPVLFMSNAPLPRIGDWYGLRIENTKSSINVNYTEIRYGEVGILYQKNQPFKIRNCAISNCNIGIASESSITLIMETEFMNNNQGAVINDGKLNMVQGCEFRANCTGLIVKDAEDKNNVEWRSGIYRSDNELRRINPATPKWCDPDDGKGEFALIFDNTFIDNDTGIIFSNNAWGMVRKNEIINNIIGVYITNNAWPILGIKMSGQNIFQVSKSPKCQNYLSEERILGYQGNCRGTTRDLTSGQVNHTNAIATPPDKVALRDDGSESVSYAVYNNTPNYILAEGNWWGTNNEDSIALFIWDYYDDPTKGIVDFEPYRSYKVAGGIQADSEYKMDKFVFEIPTIIAERKISFLFTAAKPDKPASIGVRIYDVMGRLVKSLEVIATPKRKCYFIDCGDLSKGIYFIHLEAGNFYLTKKFILMK